MIRRLKLGLGQSFRRSEPLPFRAAVDDIRLTGRMVDLAYSPPY